MLDNIEKSDNLYKLLGMKILEATPEYSRVMMPISKEITNGMGVVHGGAIFSLADIAFGAASNCDETTGTVTMSSNIHFLAPGVDGPIVAEAKRVRSGRHIVVFDINVYDAKNVLLAHAVFQGFRTDRSFVS